MSWAARTPTQTAIRKAGKNHSYAELADASAGVAAELVRRGVRSGDAVAVTGERSFAFVSAMLGVFRSGGTLLSAGSSKLPLERQKTMVVRKPGRASSFVSVPARPPIRSRPTSPKPFRSIP